MRSLLTPAAEADLEAIGDRIAEDNRVRALAFVRALRRQCERLVEFPNAYPLRPELAQDIRVLVYRRYLICYTVYPDLVVVERITQGSRELAQLFQ